MHTFDRIRADARSLSTRERIELAGALDQCAADVRWEAAEGKVPGTVVTKPPPYIPDVLTLAQVATWLQLHPITVGRLARRGRIPATRCGRHWRFYRPAIEQWLASGKR